MLNLFLGEGMHYLANETKKSMLTGGAWTFTEF
jgi:hypothetical protein